MSNSIATTKVLSHLYKSSSSTTSNNEFLAEETIVTIIPSIDHDEFRLISGTFGPLSSGLPCQVPLWLALTLKRQGKCLIKLPSWLSSQHLINAINHEKGIIDYSKEDEHLERNNTKELFQDLPHYYYEISSLLLRTNDSTNTTTNLSSSSSISDNNSTHLLSHIDNLFQLRLSRLRLFLNGFSSAILQLNQEEKEINYIPLGGIKSSELFILRNLLLYILTSTNLFNKKEINDDENEDSDED